ncbi:MAG: nucleoside-diphosphate kinase [Candidatus Krumholzibacteria bacterium]|nr:nucleoside-diphosphate kinase [Candidatus Krumholzibacteria bacterium]
MVKTLLMIKPDVVAEGHYGDIISVVLRNRFNINKLSVEHFSRERAEEFYAVHRERPFFGELVEYITGGPVVAIEVEDNGDTVARMRELIGATDPAQAKPGTIRAMYGSNIQNNAVHGSDSPENAKKELAIAFGDF